MLSKILTILLISLPKQNPNLSAGFLPSLPWQQANQIQITPPTSSTFHASVTADFDKKNVNSELPTKKLALKIKRDTKWKQNFNELLQFKSKHGHCLVPARYNENPTLGRWVNTQRQQYKYKSMGIKSHLTNERQHLLEQSGFVWSLKPNTLWDDRFEQLKQFKNDYGHCNVSQLDEDHRQLALWVMTQRDKYKRYKRNEKSSLNEVRIALLEKEGFAWEMFGQSFWESQFQELKRFKQIYGHCRVPTIYDSNPQLARWVLAQRLQYKLMKDGKKSAMTKERVHALEELGFEWDGRRSSSK